MCLPWSLQRDLQRIFGCSTITAASGNHLTLIRARAYAATIAGIRGRAALGLALVILKHEE